MTISTEQFLSVNTGTVANDGTGDSLRAAFVKVNENFNNISDIGFDAGNINCQGGLEVSDDATIFGNVITEAYFIGDGRFLSNVTALADYTNSNVAAYLPTYSGNIADVTITGNLTFDDSTVQTTAYAGGQGHAIMIDTNRNDDYVELGTADRPFKTFAAAISAVAALNPTGTVPYTFILMGCTVSEDVDFTSNNFNFITISTTCRSVITGNVTVANSNLKQLTVRNIEIGGNLTITGDGTADQMNNMSFYNASFSGTVNVTAANSLAFYEAAFFGPVNFTNVNYTYINGAQFNTDWTLTADDTGTEPEPALGVAPAIVIAFNYIANNVYFVKGGTAFIVFQPHMARMGVSSGTYTIPAAFVFQPQGCVLRGTWINDGSTTLRNTSHDNSIGNTAPSYTGILGGDRIVIDNVPTANVGAAGDRVGMVAVDSTYLYVCAADYDGVNPIWTRTTLNASW